MQKITSLIKSLIYFSFLLSLGHAFAQDYTPLLDQSNEWQLTYNANGQWTDTYFTDGDTLVDNKNYKILDGYHYISRTFLLREDAPERKVYLNFVDPGGNTEYLLYDFSMEVGDSIDMKNPITPFPEDAGHYEVTSIVLAPLADGNEYRHFYLSPAISNTVSSNDAIWIEGAGSMSMITAPSGDPDVNGVGIVSCTFRNGEVFYSDGHFTDPCESNIALGTTDFVDEFNQLQLITGTSENTYQLIHTETVKRLKIYDLQGREVKSMLNFGSSTMSLEVSSLPSGLYIIDARDAYDQKQVLKVLVN